jgi:hypothetical protein
VSTFLIEPSLRISAEAEDWIFIEAAKLDALFSTWTVGK